MRALLVKELHELAREKRFPAFLALLALVLGVGALVLLEEARGQGPDSPFVMSFREPIVALTFVGVVSCVLLAITFASDAVAKERDQGMLPLLLTSPVTHGQVLAAKLAALLVVYLAFAAVNLALAGILSLTFGMVVLKAAFWLLVLPLGAFYAFLCGLCVFLSTLFKSSKASMATSVGVVLPLVLLLQDGPVGYLLQQSRPALYDALGWLPVSAAVGAAMDLAAGTSFALAPLAVTALVGAAFAFAAHAAFRAREVAL